MSDAADASTRGMQRRRRSRPRPWREGRSTTRRWNLELLAWAVCALGAGALAGRAASVLLPPETAEGGARAVVWVALGVPIALAFSRSRPRGLLRVRLIDVVYGIVFGVALRIVQGALAETGGVPAAWPSTFSTGGSLPESFVADALADSVVAAVTEEFFFRGVVLVCAFALVRRLSGRVPAAIAAVAFSTALFVVAHRLTSQQGGVDSIALAAVGVVTGTFVMATGRIWPAVAVHVVFNATGYALLAAGALLS
ncbi:CPBP family intramembrane glutamic endopeptidase [uncultured Microbacterium sp.]|uniref:CPBP family intramembrane glutamic endopeptidase n=1 Tax=uncultured Microbacterium sp. TaxID=191216 RepID=UPI002603BA45|nr:CPBP family intramembrane glutamic endopeptidase [uncultured Microbacterium sp.]